MQAPLWILSLCLLAVSAQATEPAIATLYVGVHRQAGVVSDIAADGAAGQCHVVRSRIHCPAQGPVTFRWARGGDWALTGQTVVEPGATGVAFVLAPEASRVADRERLAADTVSPQDIRDLFVETGDNPVRAPSPAMLQDLFTLSRHPDPVIRRQVIDALTPWWRHTASDPMEVDAPQLVPGGLITQLADDLDLAVRRKLANRLREVNTPGEPLAEEATRALVRLGQERGPVQRAAISSLSIQAKAGRANLEETWLLSMGRVPRPGGQGRAAANSLARLAGIIEPSETVVPDQAVELVFTYHLERTWKIWTAWRKEVPFDAAKVDVLLRETDGTSDRLLRYWAKNSPEELLEVLTRWEPRPPHTDRWMLVTGALNSVTHEGLRQLLDARSDPTDD